MKRLSKFPIPAIIGYTVASITIIIYVISRFSAQFADFVNGTLSRILREAMARATSWIPISLFEIVIFSLPLIVALIVFLAIRAFKAKRAGRFVINLVSLILFIYSGHLLMLGVAYNTTSVGTHLGLQSVEVTEDRLADAMILLRDEANALAPEIDPELGYTSIGSDLSEISSLITDSYSALSDKYSFIPDFKSNVKGVGFSVGLSYLGLTGIYTYYTGEANVNTCYPDYKLVFTAAHELSHQRGILRENEANFMAYLVLASSSDPYLRYSAALNMYQYVASALYRTNPDRYYEITDGLADTPRADIIRSNSITLQYGDTFIADVSDFVNDLFLKSNGTEGVVSYGMVVRLALAYLEDK